MTYPASLATLPAMDTEKEIAAALLLAGLPGVGPARFRELVTEYKTAEQALAQPALRKRVTANQRRAVARLVKTLARRNIVFVSFLSPQYPSALWRKREFARGVPPPWLCVQGNLSRLLALPRVAVVGTRSPTPLGERVAEELAAALAERGIGIISGGARGVDCAAHRGALGVGGWSLVCLPTGILHKPTDRISGAAAQVGHERLVWLSEFHPGARWESHQALQRNGTIVALADAVVAVELNVRGGTANTVRKTVALGLPLFTVRWPADHPLRGGSERILEQGHAEALNDSWPPDIDACAERLCRAIGVVS